MRIAPQWDEHSVPFCTDACPAFGSCKGVLYRDVCIPAVRAMVSIISNTHWKANELREAVIAMHQAESEVDP